MVTDNDKFQKVINHLNELIDKLQEHRSVTAHTHINQFYYIQKITELQMLKERIDNEYQEVYCTWRKDIRWLNTYVLSKNEDRKSVL